MVKKIHNVIFCSDVGNGPNTTSDTFFYDWTQIPDVPYKVIFTFISGIATFANTSVPTIFIDLGQSNNQIAMAQNGSNINYNNSFLGSLFYYGSGVNLQLSADVSTNPPTFINSRPKSNNITVEIHRNLAPFTADYNYTPTAYTLILSFEEI